MSPFWRERLYERGKEGFHERITVRGRTGTKTPVHQIPRGSTGEVGPRKSRSGYGSSRIGPYVVTTTEESLLFESVFDQYWRVKSRVKCLSSVKDLCSGLVVSLIPFEVPGGHCSLCTTEVMGFESLSFRRRGQGPGGPVDRLFP